MYIDKYKAIGDSLELLTKGDIHTKYTPTETDYLALTDVTLDAITTTYRQALRDITDHVNWPHLEEGDWPVKP